MLVSISLMISAGILVLGVLPSFPAFLLGIMLIGGGDGSDLSNHDKPYLASVSGR